MSTTLNDPPSECDLGANTVGVDSACPTSPAVNSSPRDSRLKRWTNLSVLRKLLDKGAGSFGPLKATVTDLAECIGKDIDRELQVVQSKLNRDRLGRLREASEDLDDIWRCYNRIRDHLQRVSLNADISMWKIVDELATDNRLRGLLPAMSACYNSAQATELKRGSCTKGTRIDVLGQMVDWIEASIPGSVYWMSGMAGTGKTTISCSLCKDLEASGRLAASFFCSRVLPECRDVSRIIPSIAYQLARFSHPFRFALSSILGKNPDAHTCLPDLQFDTLIVQTFLHVMKGSPSDSYLVKDTLPENLVVVIDALDECEHKKSTSQILDLLLTKSADLPIKFIVSSRPESEIRDQMTQQHVTDKSRMVLHELDRHTVQMDIKTYLKSSLAQMQLSEKEIAALVERAGVLFIHAATVVRYISYDNFRGNSRIRLKNVLNASSAPKKDKEIDELYTTVLQAALDNPELEDSEKDDIRQVLHAIICAKEPLTVPAFSSLLKMNDVDRVHAALRSLWSVLHISGASELVTTLHASFPEYMLDSSRSGRYYCDPAVINGTLTLGCFDCFRNMRPQFNICGLESSFIRDDQVHGLKERVKYIITTEAFYAARYWAEHLQSAAGSSELMQELEEFLSVRLLLWMEIMNLKRSADAMTKAIQLAGVKSMEYPDVIRSLILDACWFTASFAQSPVSNSTPHIYVSMLPFWPESNPVAKHYAGRTRGMIRVNGTAMAQRHVPLATWDFDSATHSPTFSPDGTQIAVGVGLNILLLNAPTGLQMHPPLKGHSDIVLSVQFSPDGTRIVSGSFDKTIRVWSAQTGKAVLGPLKGYTDWVYSVAFSPDGSRIVSGSSDQTICIWDAYSGQHLLGPLTGHNCQIENVKYSPDGRYIISSGWSSSIVVWDSNSGEILKMLCGNERTEAFYSVDISPDSLCIAYGSGTGKMYIEDIKTEQLVLGPINTTGDRVCSISFSHDGRWLGSGSSNGTVYIWDTTSSAPSLIWLEGHSKDISSINFSPNGAYLISGSDDHTLRLRDTQSIKTAPNLFHGHTASVISVDISSDGTRIVSGSKDGSICVWDTESGETVAIIPKTTFVRVKWPNYESESGEEIAQILRVSFSPDATRIIANTNHGPFAFDSRNGAPCCLYADHIHSPNLLFLFMVLGFGTLGVSLTESDLESNLKSWHSFAVDSMLLSYAAIILAKILVSSIEALQMDFGLKTPANALHALIIQAVIILVTGVRVFGDAILGPVDIYSPHISCAELSPDGSQIVSGSTDDIIRVHDAHTNRLTLVIRLPSLGNGRPGLRCTAPTLGNYWST
ncbi:unnamed protein product [Rhizoctonia solani]|uniref:Nephrocystin 3-like N-terminal domain-containing protein n=1 Tax=Rhizoctonia solani TaxID=456999 RepID=A0A8H2XUN6_9AGAM|nr:unnamed protein product [Rhizoctonia solani]